MAASPPKGLKTVMQFANNIHVALFRISGGKFANTVANLPLLLITTSGRKSGKPHTNPVAYIKDGPGYLVTASAGGADWHPGWYLNLKKTPEVKIQIGEKPFPVQAEITSGEERTRLYKKFKEASGNFEKYEKNTSRVIPVIRLTPTGAIPRTKDGE